MLLGRTVVIGTRSRCCLAGICRVQRTERGGARGTVRALFSAPTLGQSTPRWAAPHHADAEVYPRCSSSLIAFLGASLCCCERVEKTGPAHRLLCPSTYPPTPRGHRHMVCVCARVPIPQQHQRQSTIPAAVASSPRIRALALAYSSGKILLQQ